MLDSLLEPWIPPSCASCGRSGLVICDHCRSRLVPLGEIVAPPSCAMAWAAFVYDPCARQVIHSFKFGRRHSLAAWLVDCIIATAPGPVPVPDVVTWVPASKRKRSQRGFDQGELLAQGVAARLRVGCHRLLARDDWGSQTRRSSTARRRGPSVRARAGAIGSPRVLIVDDVTTTGASLGAAAEALRRAGFGEICAATAAHSLDHHSIIKGTDVARSSQDAHAGPTQPVDSGHGRPSKHQTS